MKRESEYTELVNFLARRTYGKTYLHLNDEQAEFIRELAEKPKRRIIKSKSGFIGL